MYRISKDLPFILSHVIYLLDSIHIGHIGQMVARINKKQNLTQKSFSKENNAAEVYKETREVFGAHCMAIFHLKLTN